MIGVFIDTFIVLTLTALVVISTLYAGGGPLVDGVEAGINKANMTQLAFSSVFGSTAGSIFVAVCLLFFAFSTILSWNMFAKINMTYLFGKKSVIVLSVLATVFVFLGCLASNDLVWELTDMFNQLMVIPNVPALIMLGGSVALAVKTSKSKSKI
jgi:AGCS family alanine or glycine:cation symporter